MGCIGCCGDAGCIDPVVPSVPPDVYIAGATPAQDWTGGPCCWERVYTADSEVMYYTTPVRQISVERTWKRIFWQHKAPFYAGNWDDTTPTSNDEMKLSCLRGFAELGEQGSTFELIHEERAVVGQRVRSMVLRYHVVDVSETETPEYRYKFSLFVCYRYLIEFQSRSRCYVRREWFKLYPGACFTGTEYDNTPNSEFIIGDTYDDTPDVPDDDTTDCLCWNRTFETLPTAITFDLSLNDSPIEVFCGCSEASSPFCVNTPPSFFYNLVVSATTTHVPVASSFSPTLTAGASGIRKQQCTFPFTRLGFHTFTYNCGFKSFQKYDVSMYNSVMPAGCVRFVNSSIGPYGVDSNMMCEKSVGPSCVDPPYNNDPFVSGLCAMEDPVTICGVSVNTGLWRSFYYDNEITISTSSDVPTPPTQVCFEPVWTAIVSPGEEIAP